MITSIKGNFQIYINVPLRIFSVNATKLDFPVDLVTFTQEILDEKFFCAVRLNTEMLRFQHKMINGMLNKT